MYKKKWIVNQSVRSEELARVQERAFVKTFLIIRDPKSSESVRKCLGVYHWQGAAEKLSRTSDPVNYCPILRKL